MSKQLLNKVAVVTGGSSGIGLASAKLLREHGASVVVADRAPPPAAERGGLDYVRTDVSRLEDLDALYADVKRKHGGVDVVFANAGVGYSKPSAEVDLEFYNRVIDVNLRGVFFTVSKAMPLLRAESSVIVCSSVMSQLALPGSSLYSASKAAVRSLVRTWTTEMPPPHARFNAVCPGFIRTNIFASSGIPADQVEPLLDAITQTRVPAKRIGRPEEIAELVLFLASPRSSFCTGAAFFADGGWAQV